MTTWDAIVVGSGPNGLSAAASIAKAGYSVLVIEAAEEIGGGVRTLPLTLPGFLHDVCSAIHPLAIGSPAFTAMPLAQYGLDWVHPEIPLAHPLDGGRAVTLERSLNSTATNLGQDADTYHRLFAAVVANWNTLTELSTGKVRFPKDATGLVRAGFTSMRSAMSVLNGFHDPGARALLAGLAAHSNLPLENAFTAGFAVSLGASGHAVGWPFPRGGAGNISHALAGYLRSLGVRFECGVRVNSLDDLPRHRIVLCDISPRELLRISGSRLPEWYRRKLENFGYGPGAFKVDWALDAPIPWAAPECTRAGTVHLGGSAEEIAASERAVWAGKTAEEPFVLAAQHTPFDPSRAPQGKHTAWAYCHVPNGCPTDMTDRIERQIERFAPGFRDRILARSVLGPMALQARNSNLVGGDFCGGSNAWQQLFLRPTFLAFLTPDPRILICSASTPPGAGVHGMCGYYAARVALPRLRKWTPRPAPSVATESPVPRTSRLRSAGYFAAGVAIGVAIAILVRRKNHS